jgi:hypothetical protein
MNTILYTFFFLLPLPCSSQVLPGVDRPNAPESLNACTHESNQLLSVDEIHNEISHINNQAATIVLENVCITEHEEYTCPLDYSQFDHKLEKICGSHQGKYMESEHKIVCTPSSDEELLHQQKYIIQLLHFPDCFGTNCNAADIERLVSRSVRHYEKELEVQMRPNFFCRSEYKLHDGYMGSIMDQDGANIQNEIEEDLQKEMEDLEELLENKNDETPGRTTSEDETSTDESLYASNAAATAGVLATSTILLLIRLAV